MGEQDMLTLRVNEDLDADVQVIECHGQRVVTFDQVDALHRRPQGTAKRNFAANRKHFVEGKDYFYFEGKNGREALQKAISTKNVPMSTAANFRMYLFTMTGYLMLVKSFHDDLAWDVQRVLVDSYFSCQQRTGGADPVDLMQLMLDQIRENHAASQKNEKMIAEQHERIMENQKLIQEQQEFMKELYAITEAHKQKLSQISEKVECRPDDDAVSIMKLAEMSAWYSKKGYPHESFTTAVLRAAGIRCTNRAAYDNDYSQCIPKAVGSNMVLVCYIKPDGIQKLTNWLDEHPIEDFKVVEYYQRAWNGHAIGDVKREYYKLPGNSKKFTVMDTPF